MKVEPVWGRAVVVLSIWMTASVFAQSPKRAVILSPPSETQRIGVLKDAVTSQLSDLGVEVLVQTLEDREVISQDLLGVAERHRKESRAVAVIWVGEGGVHVLAGDEEQSNHVSRSLPTGDGDWETQCDAIASVIRSVLSPWLASHGAPAILERGPDPEAPSQVLSMPARFHAIGVAGAYAPMIMSRRQPWLHGGWLGLDVRWLEYFRMSVGGAIVPVLRRRSYGLQRIPLRVEAEGRWALGPWSLGAALSYVLDIARVRGSDLGGDANRFYHGLGVVAVMAHRPISWMELRIVGGMDLYQAANRYVDQDGETIFQYGPVQGRLGFGLVFWLWGDSFSLFSSKKHPT